MNITQLIAALEALRAEHGDLDVVSQGTKWSDLNYSPAHLRMRIASRMPDGRITPAAGSGVPVLFVLKAWKDAQ